MPPDFKPDLPRPIAPAGEVDLPALYRRRLAEDRRVSARIDATQRADEEADAGTERLRAAGHDVPLPEPVAESSELTVLRGELGVAWEADNGPNRNAVTRGRLDYLRLEAMYQHQYEEALHRRDHVRALLARAFPPSLPPSAIAEIEAARAAAGVERAAKEAALAGQEAERAAKERLAARLRAMGVDPDAV